MVVKRIHVIPRGKKIPEEIWTHTARHPLSQSCRAKGAESPEQMLKPVLLTLTRLVCADLHQLTFGR